MTKIILVDDDRTNAMLIKRLLEMDGYKVQVCPDVERALEASKRGVDAFVIDCNLSYGDDGVDLLVDIRSGNTEADRNTPVIMTSGDDRRLASAEFAGATRFLIKPYSPGFLSGQLGELLNKES